MENKSETEKKEVGGYIGPSGALIAILLVWLGSLCSRYVISPITEKVENILLGNRTSCKTSQEFADYRSSDFGYSLEYPKNWFTNAYTPNERLGTGGTPEYMLAISN